MIASQNEEVLGILDLVGEQKTYRFQGLFPPIHVVTQEKVVCFGGETSILKKTEQIVVLPMYIAADLVAMSVTKDYVVDDGEAVSGLLL